MSTYQWAFQIALAASVGIATFTPESCLAADVDWGKIVLQKIDGPYSYKSPTDLIAVVGFVTGKVEGETVLFRECSGHVRTVKLNELKPIQRNCPPGSPVGPWTLNAAGKIVPVSGYTDYAEKYLGQEKKEIDPADLPPEYKEQVKGAKPGDWVAVSYPTETGKLDLFFFNKCHGEPCS